MLEPFPGCDPEDGSYHMATGKECKDEYQRLERKQAKQAKNAIRTEKNPG